MPFTIMLCCFKVTILIVILISFSISVTKSQLISYKSRKYLCKRFPTGDDSQILKLETRLF